MATLEYVDFDRAGQRIDNFIKLRLKGIPKSRIYKAIRSGEVRVNKGRVKPTYRLQEGDMVRIPPLAVPDSPVPPPVTGRLQDWLETRVVLENDQLLVLDKPAGIPVHGGTGQQSGVLDVVKKMRPAASCLELAHRLDKGTSGCLVLAKKRKALRLLHASLRQRQVKKEYLVLLQGSCPKAFRVDLPLKKTHPSSGGHVVHVDRTHGLEARSHFTPIAVSDFATLMKVRIETGRTHQIRVHARAMGHPVAGDDKYGNDEFNHRLKRHGLRRLFLHAASITFEQADAADIRLSLGVILPDELRAVLGAIGLSLTP